MAGWWCSVPTSVWLCTTKPTPTPPERAPIGAGPTGPNRNKLLEYSFWKFHHDPAMLDIHLWHQFAHKGHLGLRPFWCLDNDSVLSRARDDTRYHAHDIAIFRIHVAALDIFRPPLPRFKIPTIRSIDHELNPSECISGGAVADLVECHDVVTLVAPDAHNLKIPRRVLVGQEDCTWHEPISRILKHPTNDNIPVDSVRSAYVPGGDAILTFRGHVR
jgi:hypothetical protein